MNELPRQNRIDESRILETYPLETIYFYLTGDCNLACRHCWISPSHQKKAVSQSALDFPLFCTIIDEAKPLGLKSVKLTGGEPLIHPRIGEIMMFIRQENLRLIIESNGIALTSEIAALIADSKNPFISISLDGADAETHEWMRGVPGSFNQALTGIRTMVDAGIRPQIVMTLTKRNVHQIQTVIDLAEHEGAESVKINILLLIARGKNLHDQGESLSLSELIEIGARIEHEIAPSTKMPVIFSHPHAFQPLNRMVDERYSCGNCHIHQIMGVLHDGSYALCGIGFTVPELVFGKAGKNRLSDLWGYHPLLQKIREGIPNQLKSPCRECVMKYRCLGCCVAQNFVASHDLLAPYWYCEEAVKQGLFPETRLME